MPGNKSLNEIKEKVSAALQIKADSVGGRFPAETINAIVVTDAKAVNINIKIMKVNNFVESLLFAEKTDEEIP